MLRPERLRLLASADVADADCNTLDATLVATVYQGDSSLFQMALADGTLVGVRGASAAPAAPGTRIRIAVSVDDTVLLAMEPGA